MGKKKRVFAAALAAALLFTMPGMASYAEAEDARTEENSESVTVLAEEDAVQETAAETEAVQEPEAEDSDTDQPEAGEDDTKDAETDEKEPAEDETVPAQKEDAGECTCGALCTQDSINGDCPVCGGEDADLSRCKGEKEENISEEKKEDAGQEDTGAQDDSANLCAHHREHTKDCGYSPASEDGEGNLCTYECKLCPIEALIAALPRALTEDNAETVRWQLDEILDLWRELSEEEQEQINLSSCWDLQTALDEANAPLEVTSIPQKAKNSDGTMLEVGSDFIYEIDGTTYNCIVVSSTSNEAAVVWKEMQNPQSDLLESKQSMILSCEEKGGRLIKYAEYQALSDYQIISLNDSYNTFGCQEYAACYYDNGDWTVDNTYTWTDWSYFIAFDLRCNSIEATENFNSEKYYDGTPFEVDTNSFTWKGTATPIIKFYSDMNGTEISAPSAVGTYYIKLSIADPVVEDGIRYEAAESDYIEITILPIITEQPESAALYYDYVAGNVLSVTVATDGVTYQWYENNSMIDGATQATYTVPVGKIVGTYQYYCKVALGDYTEQSQTANVTVVKSGSTLGSRLTVLNGETETTSFTASDTITVKATPTATGSAPAAMMVASFTQPDAGEMALFVGDTQVSEPVSAGADGTYTMTASASDVLTLAGVEPNGDAITLTAKFVGNSNMADAAATVDVTISASVKVQIGETTTYYGGIDTAWTAACAAESATVTLLANVTETWLLAVSDGDKITLNGGSYTLSILGFSVGGGQLNITGGTFEMNILSVSGGTVHLSGGIFRIGSGGGIGCTSGVANLLLNYGTQNTPHYAYYKDGKPIEMTGQNSLEGTITVQECDHTGVDPTPNNNGTHSLKCPYCGYTGDAESCSYGTEYQHDDTDHWQTCTVCGYKNKVAHILKLAVKANGTVITASGLCDCGYQKDLGTVTLTVPGNLTYNDGQTIAWTASEGLVPSFKWDASGAVVTDQPISAVGLDAGEHTLNIEVSHDSQTASCSIPVTVKPATLTANMVTLSTESVTYSGAEQKPAVTVKQSNITLAEEKDYTFEYSNNKNAGEAMVIITGQGNYTGAVRKTFKIEKAVPTVTAPTASLFYGQKLSDSTLTGGSAVNPINSNVIVDGTWSWDSKNTQPTGSGSFPAAFMPADTKNYVTPASFEVSVTVKAAEPKLTLSVPAYQIVDADVDVTCTAVNSYDANFKDGLPAITLTYKIGNGAGQTITGGKFHIPKDTKVGTVIAVTAAAAAVDGKYTAATSTATVTVTDKIPVEITGVSAQNGTYNGNKQTGYQGIPQAASYNGTFKFQYTGRNGTSYDSDNAPVNAGSYTVTVTLADESRYIGSLTLDFTIEKAAITITADSMTVNKGSTKPALTYTVSGLANGEALAAEPELSCNADMNTAGRYPITVSGAEVPNSDNYHTEITYVPGALTVTAGTSGGGSGSSGGSNGGSSGGNNNGNGSGIGDSGDNGQRSNEDNGGRNTTPVVPAVPAVTDTNPGTDTDTETAKPGAGNTAKPGTGTEPERGAAKEERPDTGVPFIKGEDGKSVPAMYGWNAIRAEEEKAEEGSVINVDMNGTAVVPGDIFDSIKGRDIIITFDMGNGIIWSVDGKSVTTDKADDIDLTVRTGGSAVPVETVNNVTGEHYSIQISLAHDGEFGFIAVLSVNLGEENAGYLASLYYYNEDAGELELICADEVAQDGTVSFAFTHASDYVVVVDRVVEEESGGVTESVLTESRANAEEHDTDTISEENPKTGQERIYIVAYVMILIILVIAAIVIFLQWKREEKNG